MDGYAINKNGKCGMKKKTTTNSNNCHLPFTWTDRQNKKFVTEKQKKKAIDFDFV